MKQRLLKYMKDSRGFNLIELMVVISIIGIVLTITGLNLNSWQRKYKIESQTREMMTDLSDARLAAIQTKLQHTMIINPQGYELRRYSSEADVVGTQVYSKSVPYIMQQLSGGAYSNFSNTTIIVDPRGYTGSLMTIAVAPGETGATVNCLTVHWIRVNLGQVQGGDCVFQ
jgi:prepilin-type N-terminal cleavage/methylation domain-containing protein